MPTIDISLADLSTLVGQPLTRKDVEHRLELCKGEVKRGSTDTELRVELQDTNRPDLWCIEGVARQIRQRLASPARPWRKDYAFLAEPAPAQVAIEVDASCEGVRPFVAAFRAHGLKVDDQGLKAFIQAQETLSNNFGRKRSTVAIGIYDGAKIAFPVTYKATALDDPKSAFVPLRPQGDLPASPAGALPWDQKWTPAQILRDHPTGREFAPALKGAKLAPLLVDKKGEVLSFPPILNSQTLGRVVPGMTELFVEVTGTVLDHVLLAANILAANLHDRGAKIEAVVTRYSYDTPRGRELTTPHWLPEKRILRVPIARFRALLGEPKLEDKTVLDALMAYGLEVGETKDRYILVEAPPYRMDYLHEVDAVEDFAMSRGYEAFVPLMPQEFSVGRIAPATEFADKARDRMIGYGFEEAISNILTEEAHLRSAMNLEGSRGLPLLGERPVKIANVMNASYSCLRDWILPSLLEAESRSAGAVYPHRIFESGEVAVHDPDAPVGSRTDQRLGALVAHESASFSEAQAILNLLLVHLGAGSKGRPDYSLAATLHPSFIPGRAVAVRLAGVDRPVGVLGELHPEVLAGDRGWGIRVPCAAFEVSLDALRAALGASPA